MKNDHVLALAFMNRLKAELSLVMNKYDRALCVKESRTLLNLTQREYAKRINGSHSTIADWERPLDVGSREEWNRLINLHGETNVYKDLRKAKPILISNRDVINDLILVNNLLNKVLNGVYDVKIMPYLMKVKQNLKLIELRIKL